MNILFHSYIEETIICVGDDMSEQFADGNENKRIKEEKMIFRMLRLLAEEHLISLEEEMKGKELFQRKPLND